MSKDIQLADAFLTLATAVNDKGFIARLTEVRDQAIRELKNLGDVSAQALAVATERKQLEKDKADHAAHVAEEKDEVAKARTKLERDQRLHSEAADTLAADRKAFDHVHAEFVKFRAAVK